MKHHFLASACALAFATLAAGSASAANIATTLSTDYSMATNNGATDVWGANGSVTGGLTDDFAAELAGGYHTATEGGAHQWDISGNLIWAKAQGHLAASVQYHGFSGVNVTSYGIGGAWFATPDFTFTARGGGLSSDAPGSSDGGYAGGMLQFYPTVDLSLTGTVDYVNLSGSHTTSENGAAEWLVSETVPISLFGGYKHADSGRGGSGDTLFFGIRLYTNDNGAMNLIDRQRTGSIGYLSASPL